jgi:transcriptional regulator NrdR family protein
MPIPHNMICSECGHKSIYVIETRSVFNRTIISVFNRTIIRRRRECPECKARFTTYEVIAPSAKHIIILGEWEIDASEMSKRHDGILG